jgi:cupin
MMKAGMKSASLLAVAIFAMASAVCPQGAGDTPKTSGDDVPGVSTAPVHYYTSQQVTASFEKTGGGDLLYDGDKGTRNFTAMTSVRSNLGPSTVEVHTKVTDLIYIVKGSATIVTGGKLSGVIEEAKNPTTGKPYPKDEIRARSIIGGESRHLATGDVIVIPNGVPHLFSNIEEPFWYHLVKIRQP